MGMNKQQFNKNELDLPELSDDEIDEVDFDNETNFNYNILSLCAANRRATSSQPANQINVVHISYHFSNTLKFNQILFYFKVLAL